MPSEGEGQLLSHPTAPGTSSAMLGGFPWTCRTCSENTSASPLALCKCLASQRQFRSGPVQPGQTYSPSTGPQSYHLPSGYTGGREVWRHLHNSLNCRACASETWATVTYAPGRNRAPRKSPHDTEAQTRQSAVFKRKIYLTSST